MNVSFMRAPIIFLWVIHNLLHQQHKNSLLHYIVLRILSVRRIDVKMWSSLPKINRRATEKFTQSQWDTFMNRLCLHNSPNKRLKRIIIIICRELFSCLDYHRKNIIKALWNWNCVSGGCFFGKNLGKRRKKNCFHAVFKVKDNGKTCEKIERGNEKWEC